MNPLRIAVRPSTWLLGTVAAAVAGALVDRLWCALSGSDSVPHASDPDRRLGEILTAAALHGAVFAAVLALADRAGTVGVHRLTGRWPD